MRVINIFFIIAAAASLAGCILQSTQPQFTNADSKPLLAPYGNLLTLETRSNGKWASDGDIYRATWKGKAYVISKANDPATITLRTKQLDEAHWLLELAQTGKSLTYVYATPRKSGITLQAYDCGSLKSTPLAARSITFGNDDCSLRDTLYEQDWSELARALPGAKLRIVRAVR